MMARLPYTAREMLAQRASSAQPRRVAIVDGTRRLTYGELLARAHGFANALLEAGVSRGDRVGVFLRRSADAAAALFGTWFAGAVPVVLNEQLRAAQVLHILTDSEASCVITENRLLPSIPEHTGPVLDVDAIGTSTTRCAVAPLIGADLAALVYTSGSTGLPKGAMLSHDNLVSGVQIVSQYLELTERDVILSILPFSFDYGLNQLLTSVYVGGTLVIQRSLFPPDICRTLEQEGITGLAGVPTLWLQLTGRQSPFLKKAFPALRYITNSGGQLPENTVRSIRTAHPGLAVVLMYGLTEAFRSTYLPADEVDRRPTSMGKAIPNVEILVVDGQGRPCGPGEVGELVHRGANIFMGYWRDPESTARVLKPNPRAGGNGASRELTVFSGDLVRFDEDGYLYYVGRKDTLIKSRGVRVSPEEIERGVYASDLVSHAVAFAVPQEHGESDIVLAVVPADPGFFTAQLLESFCRRHLPEYMWPRVVWSLPAFPLTSTGKPDRCRIRQLYVEHLANAGTAA